MKRNHVLITGTGRAGTTFLVQLLTKIGIDTGFDSQNIDTFIDQTSFGGLELDIRKGDAPYVVKSPRLSFLLDDVFQNEDITIDAVVVPFRAIKEATASRLRVQTENGHYFPNSIPGGIASEVGGEDQEQELHLWIERLLLSVSRTHVPIIFIAYPLLMRDKKYLFIKLASIFPNIQFETFSEAFDSIYVPQRVHEFNSVDTDSLQSRESDWNQNFVSNMIQKNLSSEERISQLELLNAQLQTDFNQLTRNKSVRTSQPFRNVKNYLRKFFTSKI